MSPITRRSLVAGLSLSTATIAVASAACVVTEAELSSMVIDGRRVSVDTTALPQTFLVSHEDEGAGSGVDRVSTPEEGVEYLVMTWDGDLRITPLVNGYVDEHASVRGRLGFMPAPAKGDARGTPAAVQVKVIGRVVG